MLEKCSNCGGWDETEYPWDGDVGYPCYCIRCPTCGDVYGCSEETQAWNTEQWELHIADYPKCFESGVLGARTTP